MQLLGVRNSSVFLTNCTIWVEGITDRRYLARYLTLYQQYRLGEQDGADGRQFTEDLHYSFVEYGGANITHWSFLEEAGDAIDIDRLCGRLFLIADSDGQSNNKKSARHDTLLRRLGDRYACLPCREIENLLSPQVLEVVISAYEGGGTFPGLVYAEYRDKRLGQFIDEFLGPERKRVGAYAAESGTVTDKVTFCARAVEALRVWSDVTEDAQQLTEKIYAFIAAHNT